jgi:hypothetical protein
MAAHRALGDALVSMCESVGGDNAGAVRVAV